MLLKQEIKQYQKNVVKTKKKLMSALSLLDRTLYTEQNTEDLNDLRDFIVGKINILSEIENYVSDYLNNKLQCSFIGFVGKLMTLKNRYHEFTQDDRLNYLQTRFLKNNNEQTVYEEFNFC